MLCNWFVISRCETQTISQTISSSLLKFFFLLLLMIKKCSICAFQPRSGVPKKKQSGKYRNGENLKSNGENSKSNGENSKSNGENSKFDNRLTKDLN